jgi:hypothetical protein
MERKERKVKERRAVPKDLERKVEQSNITGTSEHNKKEGGQS